MDYYTILGLSKGASESEIKAAYRKQALKWHPDKNKDPDAEKKFKEINQAFEVLSNSEKRSLYDQFGHEAFTKQGFGRASARGGAQGEGFKQQGPFTYTYSSTGGSPFADFDVGGFSDPFEIFEQFFGGGSPFGGRAQTPLYQISISFDEAVRGVEKQVSINGKSKTIKIPAGVDTGMQIRFTDFSVIVSVGQSSTFNRQGQDIYVEVYVPFTKAILGDTIKVPTIDKKDITLKIRPGTQPGTIIRLRGNGMPYPRQNQRGDQYVVLKISLPENLNRNQKELIKELDKEL